MSKGQKNDFTEYLCWKEDLTGVVCGPPKVRGALAGMIGLAVPEDAMSIEELPVVSRTGRDALFWPGTSGDGVPQSGQKLQVKTTPWQQTQT